MLKCCIGAQPSGDKHQPCTKYTAAAAMNKKYVFFFATVTNDEMYQNY